VAGFGSLRIAFDDRLLRPRAWTEAQARWGADLALGASPRILELCAGAGHIGLLALALHAAPGAHLVSVEANPVACRFIRDNARSSGLDDRVEIRLGDLTDALHGRDRFDVVIADPPWVERAHVADHPDDPVQAIDGGVDGLDVAVACLRVAARHLQPHGSMLLQLGSSDQADRLERRCPASSIGLGLTEVRAYGNSGAIARYVQRAAPHTSGAAGPT
jgi:release factor glutamine methyltransferase